jgi:phage-related baseplate assembly protein
MAARSSSTTVDLSRLTAPIIVEQKPFETILAEMVAQVQALLPSFDATVDSDPAVKVLQVAAYREVLIRQVAQDGGKQVMVAFATGAQLDHLAALVGVARLVITPADTAAGTAPVLEDDSALRQRIVLAPEGFSVAGPELAYVFHAKSAAPGVLDASATSPIPGEVVVSVLSRDDDGTASAVLLDAVAAVVTDPGIRPLGDAVSVRSAEIVPFAIVADLITFTGPDRALLLASARTRLDAYLANSRKLGRDITRSAIFGALMTEGVQNAVIHEPAADVVCDLTEAAHCTAITLGFGGYGE